MYIYKTQEKSEWYVIYEITAFDKSEEPIGMYWAPAKLHIR